MATATEVKGTKSFCDDVYTELIGMRNRLSEMKDRSRKQGAENAVIGTFERHLAEIVDEIDWKLQILAHSCPYDWKGSVNFESNAQVDEEDRLNDPGFSPGYLGG